MPNWKKLIVSGSDASLTSLNISGNLTASAAYLESASIGYLETIYETASVIYSSGSTKFGDTSDDTHERTGSLFVSGNISIVEGGSLIGTASHALTAITSSHTTGTASISNYATSASFAITASHLIGNTGNSGSFSGSFQGNGSNLTGITVAQSTLTEDTFTSQTSITASHLFNSKNVNVIVYDNNDNLLIPENIRTLDDDNVGVDLAESTTGRIVLTKGGHIVTGSVAEQASVTASFTTATSVTSSHNFGSLNVLVTTYKNDGEQFVPQTIRTLDDNNVGLDFAESTTGRVVIARGGHLLAGTAVTASFAITSQTSSVSLISNELSPLATASFSNTSITSSHTAGTASISNFSTTASFTAGTASISNFSTTASFAVTASHALNSSGGGSTTIIAEQFDGNNSTTAFNLSNTIVSEDNTQVYIDGAYQSKDNYSTNGTTLTFSTAPPTGTGNISVTHFVAIGGTPSVEVDTFNGDNSDTTFTLTTEPATKNNLQIYIDGVYQAKANYSTSGTTLTFTTAPPTGTNNIEITHIKLS